MPSMLWTTGPAYFFAKRSFDPLPLYLGTCERKPIITQVRAFTSVLTDEGGSVIPRDKIYEGREATVTGILNRLDMKVMRFLMNSPAEVDGWPQNRPLAVDDGFGNRLADFPIGRQSQDVFGVMDRNDTDGMDWIENYGALIEREGLGVELWILFSRITPYDVQSSGMIQGYHFYSAVLASPDVIEPGGADFRQGVVFHCHRVLSDDIDVQVADMELPPEVIPPGAQQRAQMIENAIGQAARRDWNAAQEAVRDAREAVEAAFVVHAQLVAEERLRPGNAIDQRFAVAQNRLFALENRLAAAEITFEEARDRWEQIAEDAAAEVDARIMAIANAADAEARRLRARLEALPFLQRTYLGLYDHDLSAVSNDARILAGKDPVALS